MRRIAQALFLPFALLALFACTNSDDYLYNEEDSTFIEVSAEMAYSFDSGSERFKQDTIKPGDSLIFIANILPSKSIKIKHYRWTIDGEPLSYDFSFRSSVREPGMHQVAFFLETYFGDTLSDTLTLWVSNPPVLLEKEFIPAAGTQGLPTTGGISFAWKAYDPDSLAGLYYRFTIDGYIDTLISTPYFTFWETLPPLSHFIWHVQAINEFGLVSSNTLQGDFFTRGGQGETGLTGFIGISSRESFTSSFAVNAKITILDTLLNEVYSNNITWNDQNTHQFVASPLVQGQYKVVLNIPKYTDFVYDTLDVELFANEILDLGTILLRDTVPPQIGFINNGTLNEKLDTLDYADTLKFLVKDFGSPSAQKTASAFLESTFLIEKQSSNDTLTVVLPETARTWNMRQLNIVATDASKNKTTRTFTIKPANSWIRINSNATLSDADTSVTLFAIDNNPYGFQVDSCKFNVNGERMFAFKNTAGFICKAVISTSELHSGVNSIRNVIVYTNGISYWEDWQISYNKTEPEDE